MNTKIFALVALISMFAMASTQNYGQTYCGRQLAETLAALCDNLIKRSEPRYPGVEGLAWPWIPRHSARSLGRSKRQVVSECCDKPCTIDELLSYCGN